MGDTPGAFRRFSEAYELASNLESSPAICTTSAGLAACAVMQGQVDEARKYINKAWDYLKEFGLVALENPAMIYRTCAEVFDALGEEESVQAVLESGHRIMLEVADKINVPEWRQSFLENEIENRAFIELWERHR
jgi:Tfp pilus assembly protein PilF